MRAGQAANSGWPDSKCSVLGAHMALLSFDAAKVRRFHCGGRIFRGLFFDSSRFFLRGHVVMMVMVKMVKIEMEKKEKSSIIYNIYIFIYYSIKMALPKIDFDQNDHDHFDHDTGAVSVFSCFNRFLHYSRIEIWIRVKNVSHGARHAVTWGKLQERKFALL